LKTFFQKKKKIDDFAGLTEQQRAKMLMKLPRWKIKNAKAKTKLYSGSEDEMSYLSVFTGWTVPEIEVLQDIEVNISKLAKFPAFKSYSIIFRKEKYPLLDSRYFYYTTTSCYSHSAPFTLQNYQTFLAAKYIIYKKMKKSLIKKLMMNQKAQPVT